MSEALGFTDQKSLAGWHPEWNTQAQWKPSMYFGNVYMEHGRGKQQSLEYTLQTRQKEGTKPRGCNREGMGLELMFSCGIPLGLSKVKHAGS